MLNYLKSCKSTSLVPYLINKQLICLHEEHKDLKLDKFSKSLKTLGSISEKLALFQASKQEKRGPHEDKPFFKSFFGEDLEERAVRVSFALVNHLLVFFGNFADFFAEKERISQTLRRQKEKGQIPEREYQFITQIIKDEESKCPEVYQQDLDGINRIVDQLHLLHSYLGEKTKVKKHQNFYQSKFKDMNNFMNYLRLALAYHLEKFKKQEALEPAKQVISGFIDKINKVVPTTKAA